MENGRLNFGKRLLGYLELESVFCATILFQSWISLFHQHIAFRRHIYNECNELRYFTPFFYGYRAVLTILSKNMFKLFSVFF